MSGTGYNRDKVGSATNDKMVDVLLADLNGFSESFWKNESIGETRVQFFLGLVTAVISALVAFATLKTGQKEEFLLPGLDVMNITIFALTSLLILGVVTLLRMVKRNCVTEEYKQAMDYARRRLAAYGLPDYDPFPKDVHLPVKSGGLAHFVALVNCLIVAALVYVAYSGTKSHDDLLGAIMACLAAILAANAQIAWAKRTREEFKEHVKQVYNAQKKRGPT